MDADSTEDGSLPPPRIHISGSLPGSSVPIRAPLTIDSDSDSDSDFFLPVNDNFYSRSSSFNSCSSIDISSYGDEHTSVLEEEDNAFVVYPDEEIVIESPNGEKFSFFRPSVKYPDGNYVNESSNFKESAVFRPSVRTVCEESSSADVGIKLAVPIAPLTSDCDSDTDVDSVDGRRRFDSGRILADRNVEKVFSAPKVRIFDGDEGDDEADDELRVEGVFSGDGVTGIEEMNPVSDKLYEDDGCTVECLNEVVMLSGSDELSQDSERVNAQIASSSNDEIDFETIDVKLSESDGLSFDLERIDAQIVPSLNSEIEIDTINVKLSESDELSSDLERHEAQIVSGLSSHENETYNINVEHSESDVLSSDLGRIDAQTVSSLNSENETYTIGVILSESDESSYGLEIIDDQTVSSLNSEYETYTINVKPSEELSSDLERIDTQIVSSLNSENETYTIDVEFSESDELSSDWQGINAQTVSNSDNENAIKTTDESEQEVVFDSGRNESKETLSVKEDKVPVKMQPIRAKFKRLALRNQLTTEVNREGRDDKFDFRLTILAIGMTGVGKSATINSIFGEKKALTNAFNPGTATIQVINGNVDGIQFSVIDTPGLKCSSFDRSYNLRILKDIKRFTQKHTPDVVLYVDRLDTHTLDNNDSQHLRLITSSLGSSVWGKCIVVLTHATSTPLDESSREFVNQRCRFIQEQIVRNGGSDQYLASPVWLVENNPSYKHDIIDLDEDGFDQVPPFEPSRESQDVVNRSVQHKSLFQRLQLSLKLSGNRNWGLEGRLYS